MSRLSDLLATNWFAFTLVVAGLLAAGVSLYRQQRRGRHSLGFLILAAALSLLGIGGLVLGDFLGLCLASAAIGGLISLLVVLLFTTKWWPAPAWGLAALLVLGVGGAIASTSSETLAD